ncbi:MAG: CAP domain-containing protein [Patescibacteria group bacterium]|jgi:uncharacterized protein YkwD
MKQHLSRFFHASKRISKDYFVPHEGNDHKPKAIRHQALFAYSFFLIIIKLALISAQLFLPSASLYSSAVTRENIIDLTNASRRSAGLTELVDNTKLDAAAQAKAEDMILNQYFAHTSPANVTPWQWILSNGYAYELAGENLAVYYTQAEDTLAGWLASPTHRANIMDERFADIGVGVARGNFNNFENSIVVVQMFGKPRNKPSEILAQETEPETKLATITNVVLTTTGVEVAVTAPTADEVEVSLNENSVELVKDERTDIWTGTVSTISEVPDTDGADVFVQAKKDGESEIQKAGWVAGSSDSRDVFYAEGGNRQLTLLGFLHINGIEDTVRQLFLLTMAVLSAILLASILIKFEIQHHTIIAHTIVVIVLAGLLAWI